MLNEAQALLDKIDELNETQFDAKLDDAAEKIRAYVDRGDELSAEELQALFELVQTSKGIVAAFMQENRTTVWQQELDSLVHDFATFEEDATPAMTKQFNNLKENAQRAIDANSPTAEKLLQQMHDTVGKAMFSNDEVFLAIFSFMAQNPQDFKIPALYRQLIAEGMQCVQKNDISGLKGVISRLLQIRIPQEGSKLDEMLKGSGLTK